MSLTMALKEPYVWLRHSKRVTASTVLIRLSLGALALSADRHTPPETLRYPDRITASHPNEQLWLLQTASNTPATGQYFAL
jgi:hypothetical protein